MGIEYEKTRDTGNDIIIRIKNFRSIEEISLTIEKIAILIGKNNSGKSNIMIAINKAIESKDISIDDLNNKAFESKVEIDYQGATYTAIAKPDENNNASFKWLPKKPPFKIIYLKAIPEFEDATSSVKTKTYGQLIDLYDNEITLLNDVNIDEKIKELAKHISDEENKKFSLLKPKILQSLINCDSNINDIFYKTLEINTENFLKNRNLFVEENKIKSDWMNMGHGTRRLILMTYYSQLANTINEKEDQKYKEIIVCVEEPEIFMHPQQQRAVANELYNNFTKQSSNLRIIVSTHSPYFIDDKYLNNLRIIRKINTKTTLHKDGEQVDKYDPEKCYLYGKTGEVCLDSLLKRFRIEPDLKEVFFAEKVIIAEGYNEKLCLLQLMNHILKDKNYKLDKISIINADGNRNIKATAEILHDFKIPFIIVMDNDDNDAITKKLIDDKILPWLESAGYSVNNLVLFDGDFCSSISGKTQSDKNAFTIFQQLLSYINENKQIAKIEEYIKEGSR